MSNFLLAYENVNYVLKGNLAYTEDSVLIHNLFVYHIPSQLTDEEVRAYFAEFGQIETMRFIAFKGRNNFRIGFINYVEAVSAAAVLRKNHHILRGFRIQLKSNDSWNQPHDNQVCPTANVQSSTLDNASLSLLDLPDDCLKCIYQYLTLTEQTRLSRVSKNFSYIFQVLGHHNYKKFNLDQLENMSLWEIRDFFSLVGESIEVAEGTIYLKDSDRVVGLINTYCKKLRCLKISYWVMRLGRLSKSVQSLQNLSELRLSSCYLIDESIKTLMQIKCLEALDVSDNYNLTGRYLKNLTHVKKLILHDCFNISSKHFVATCKSLRSLHVLDIRCCENIYTNTFYKMVKYCMQLEDLSMSCRDERYELVAQLPCLKKLELWYSVKRTEIFRDLAKYKANQLENLKIVALDFLTSERFNSLVKLKNLKSLYLSDDKFMDDAALLLFQDFESLQELIVKHCPNITDRGILILLQYCHQLRYVNVSGNTHITTELIKEAIKLLAKRRHTLQKPVILIVNETSITEDSLLLIKEYDENAKAELLKVEFKALLTKDNLEDEMELDEVVNDVEMQ